MKKTTFIGLTAVLAVSLINMNHVAASTINWVDILTVPGQTGVVIDDPILGQIQVTTSFPAQATFSGTAGSLDSNTWEPFNYINYDGSTTGTNGPISTTMTFQFLNGPVDTALTPLFFSANGLAANSSYTIDNNPVFLGDIGAADGTGTHTQLGGGLLRIEGTGFNHNPDFFEFTQSFISSISVVVNQVNGDGTGFAIGAALLPEASPVPVPASLWLLISGCVTLVGLKRKQQTSLN